MSGLAALLVLVVVPLLLAVAGAHWGVDSRDARWSLTSRDEGRGPVSHTAH